MMNDGRPDFSELLTRYASRIFNLSFRLTGNRVDAEDLTQEVFLNALKGIQSFENRSDISTWLYRIAANLWSNKVSRRNKVIFLSIDNRMESGEGEGLERQFEDTAERVEQKKEKEELEDAIQKALDGLNKEQKTAIVLKYVEGKSFEEIAGICGCSVGTVGSRLARGLKILKEKLKPHLK